MQVRWRKLDDHHLRVRLEAETHGWIAVGFNGREELGGTRLFMGVVDADGARVEQHIADPPRHGALHPAGKDDALSGVRGGRDGASSWVEFTLRLDPPGTPSAAVRAPTGGSHPWTPLLPGARLWVTLAWSRDADLQHHSAMRTARWAAL